MYIYLIYKQNCTLIPKTVQNDESNNLISIYLGKWFKLKFDLIGILSSSRYKNI
jgi:hypothetical protein